MQSKCSQNAAKIQQKFSQNSIKIQTKCSQSAIKIQQKFRKISVKMQPKCSQNADKMQTKYSQNAVKIFQSCFFNFMNFLIFLSSNASTFLGAFHDKFFELFWFLCMKKMQILVGKVNEAIAKYRWMMTVRKMSRQF